MQTEIMLIRIDLILETIGAIIAFAISHYANTAYKLTREKRLSDLSTGFLVLSVSMFGRVIGTIYFFVLADASGSGEALSLRNIVIIAYEALRIMAYALFALSTRRGVREYENNAPLMLLALPGLIDPNLEMIAIIVLLVVVLQALINYASNRSRFALYVVIGFLFLLLSHIFLIFSFNEYRGYILSQLSQFLGLIALLVMLIKAGR